MPRGRVRSALVGAVAVVLIALAAGWLVGFRDPGIPRRVAQTVTTTSIATTTTCLPIGYIVPPSSSRVVTVDSPRVVDVGVNDNGTEYDVPVGTDLNLRLDSHFIAGACGPPAWTSLIGGPTDVLRLENGSEATEGPVAAGRFEAVGLGTATLSSTLLGCAGAPPCVWSVSVRVTPRLALAGPAELLTVAPTSGPPGTVISVSGHDCARSGVATSAIDVVVNLTTTDGQTGFAAAHVATQPDGSWTGTLTVPPTADPSIGYLVNASCVREGDELLFDYESVAFDVTELPRTELPRTE
jgi:hypothetical protein